MFADPIPFSDFSSGALADNPLPRVAAHPGGRFQKNSATSTRILSINHANYKDAQKQLRKRTTVNFAVKTKIDPVSTGSCCTEGYIEEINASLTFNYPVGAAQVRIEDAVKSLAWQFMENGGAAQFVDKLTNQEQ